MRSVVRDGRFIHLYSGALMRRALFRGRLHNQSGHRDSAAHGCNDAKKLQSLHAPQWLSLVRHRAKS
jgi:hypothetical protein